MGWGRLPGEELPVSDALCGAGAWQAAAAEGFPAGHTRWAGGRASQGIRGW